MTTGPCPGSEPAATWVRPSFEEDAQRASPPRSLVDSIDIAKNQHHVAAELFLLLMRVVHAVIVPCVPIAGPLMRTNPDKLPMSS